MAINYKLKFTFAVLVFSVVNDNIVAETGWILEYDETSYNIVYMSSSFSPNDAIIINTTQKASLSSCAIFCKTVSAKSWYYTKNDKMCHCNNELDTNINENTDSGNITDGVAYGYINSSVHTSTNSSNRLIEVYPYQENCFDLRRHGYLKNATYVIKPTGGNPYNIYCDMNIAAGDYPDDCLRWLQLGYVVDAEYKIHLSNGTSISVWCDMSGGGWTVIQRRQDGSVNFNRGWVDYVNGFGSVSGEHWIGLEAMYLLTRTTTSLMFELGTFGDVSPVSGVAEYSGFSLSNLNDEYRLSYNTYVGGVGDSLTALHKGQHFTTFDNDNDDASFNCATMFAGGGWWYASCYQCNLNGAYHGVGYSGALGLAWEYPWTTYYTLKSCSMKIKRIY